MAVILRYFTEFGSFWSALRKNEDVAVKKFTFSISSPDEFLVLGILLGVRPCLVCEY